MSASSPGFLRRLFLRPALWVAILPGMVLALQGNGCWGDLPVLGSALCATLAAYSPSDGLFWGMIAVLYIGLRGLDAKKMWDATHEVAWFSEVALLVVGGYLVWFSVVGLIYLFLYKAVDS